MGFETASFTSVGNRGLNPTISLARTRRVENPVWNFTLPYTFQGTVAGYTSGGRFSPVGQGEASDVIDKFPFATNANATDVGDLTAVPGVGIAGDGRRNVSGQSSDVSGYTSGGYNPSAGPPTATNIIDKFPFATNANATDVGDLTALKSSIAGQSSGTSGYVSGGDNVIEKFPFASNGNATDVGDLTVGRSGVTGQSSTVSGYTSGGTSNGNVIDKFPFASDANATDVGDMTTCRSFSACQSSSKHGYVSAGAPGPGAGGINDKFPFATDSNATNIGYLTSGGGAYGTGFPGVAGQSSETHGYSSGGNIFVQSLQNIIDRFSFASDGNATDVGDLTQARAWAAGQQD